jgi:DnaJ like chaperone protein
MGWWGKIIGGTFGYLIGGPLGAVLGAALGHNFDKGLKAVRIGGFEPGEQERIQTAFFTATFSVMGHIAKADGRVSDSEIKTAEAVMAQMALTGEMRQTAVRLFSEGKRDDFPLADVLDQFRRECHRRHTLIRMFMEIQIHAALADGEMHSAELKILQTIGDRLGVNRRELDQLIRMLRAEVHGYQRQASGKPAGPTLDESYAILGLTKQANDAEVKRAYRRLMSQHHPDKLVAKGLPEEMMKLAATKTHEIKQAYDRIREARGR